RPPSPAETSKAPWSCPTAPASNGYWIGEQDPEFTNGDRSIARIFVCVILGLVLSANPSYAAGKVTLENLLRQMTELSLLAEFPDPPYVTRQFSSYDRASESPGKESWFANDDHGFMLYDGVVKGKTLYFKSLAGLKAAEGSFAAGTK